MKLKFSSHFLFSLLLPLAVGSLSYLFSRNGIETYGLLPSPPLSPPNVVFPVVWTILYLLMGVSFFLICQSYSRERDRAFFLYGVQLFFNFFWSILFFTFSAYLLAFVWLIVLIVLIALMIASFYRISPASAYLQIPYLLWCLFAAYLNLAVFLMQG